MLYCEGRRAMCYGVPGLRVSESGKSARQAAPDVRTARNWSRTRFHREWIQRAARVLGSIRNGSSPPAGKADSILDGRRGLAWISRSIGNGKTKRAWLVASIVRGSRYLLRKRNPAQMEAGKRRGIRLPFRMDPLLREGIDEQPLVRSPVSPTSRGFTVCDKGWRTIGGQDIQAS